jgi:hypothetical protein
MVDLRQLEEALSAAEELGDGATAYLIERRSTNRERSRFGFRRDIGPAFSGKSGQLGLYFLACGFAAIFA